MTYKEVCDLLDQLWVDRWGYIFCWGCRKSGPYQHHHVISRQDCSKIGKPELVVDPENLIPLCHDCHHNKWHGGGVKEKMELQCIDIILDIYKKHSDELYYNLKFKIDEYRAKEDARPGTD